jgi:hypothetical protein
MTPSIHIEAPPDQETNPGKKRKQNQSKARKLLLNQPCPKRHVRPTDHSGDRCWNTTG